MKLDDFLEDSPMAERIKLPTRIVVHRGELSPADIATIKSTGQYVASTEPVCELRVNGTILAHGRVIKRHGCTYLKITAIGEPS